MVARGAHFEEFLAEVARLVQFIGDCQDAVLELQLQVRDQLCFRNVADAVRVIRLFAGGDRDERCAEASAADVVDDWRSGSGGVDDERGPRGERFLCDELREPADDFVIRSAQRDSLDVTHLAGGLGDPVIGARIALSGVGDAVLEDDDRGVVAELSEVDSDVVVEARGLREALGIGPECANFAGEGAVMSSEAKN